MNNTDIEFTRVHRSLAEAEEYYSRLSRIYDWLAASEKKFIKLGLAILDPKQGERILEMGFGTGFAQERLIRILGNNLSVGVDLSKGMVRVARDNLIKAGLKDQLALVQNDCMPLPFTKECFEGVFTSFMLELFDTPHIPVVLKEIRRVLKPRGRLVCVSLSKDVPLPVMGRIYENLHNRFPRLLDCRPIPLSGLVEDGGYKILQTKQTRMWGLPVTALLATS